MKGVNLNGMKAKFVVMTLFLIFIIPFASAKSVTNKNFRLDIPEQTQYCVDDCYKEFNLTMIDYTKEFLFIDWTNRLSKKLNKLDKFKIKKNPAFNKVRGIVKKKFVSNDDEISITEFNLRTSITDAKSGKVVDSIVDKKLQIFKEFNKISDYVVNGSVCKWSVINKSNNNSDYYLKNKKNRRKIKKCYSTYAPVYESFWKWVDFDINSQELVFEKNKPVQFRVVSDLSNTVVNKDLETFNGTVFLDFVADGKDFSFDLDPVWWNTSNSSYGVWLRQKDFTPRQGETVNILGDHLVISEINYDDAVDDANEYVVLYNPTSFDVVINSSWEICDEAECDSLCDGVIASDGYYFISDDGGSNTGYDCGLTNIGNGLGNTGDSIALKYDGVSVDEVCWEGGSVYGEGVCDSGATDQPIGREPDYVDTGDNENDFSPVSRNPLNSSDRAGFTVTEPAETSYTGISDFIREGELACINLSFGGNELFGGVLNDSVNFWRNEIVTRHKAGYVNETSIPFAYFDEDNNVVKGFANNTNIFNATKLCFEVNATINVSGTIFYDYNYSVYFDNYINRSFDDYIYFSQSDITFSVSDDFDDSIIDSSLWTTETIITDGSASITEYGSVIELYSSSSSSNTQNTAFLRSVGSEFPDLNSENTFLLNFSSVQIVTNKPSAGDAGAFIGLSDTTSSGDWRINTTVYIIGGGDLGTTNTNYDNIQMKIYPSSNEVVYTVDDWVSNTSVDISVLNDSKKWFLTISANSRGNSGSGNNGNISIDKISVDSIIKAGSILDFNKYNPPTIFNTDAPIININTTAHFQLYDTEKGEQVQTFSVNISNANNTYYGNTTNGTVTIQNINSAYYNIDYYIGDQLIKHLDNQSITYITTLDITINTSFEFNRSRYQLINERGGIFNEFNLNISNGLTTYNYSTTNGLITAENIPEGNYNFTFTCYNCKERTYNEDLTYINLRYYLNGSTFIQNVTFYLLNITNQTYLNFSVTLENDLLSITKNTTTGQVIFTGIELPEDTYNLTITSKLKTVFDVVTISYTNATNYNITKSSYLKRTRFYLNNQNGGKFYNYTVTLNGSNNYEKNTTTGEVLFEGEIEDGYYNLTITGEFYTVTDTVFVNQTRDLYYNFTYETYESKINFNVFNAVNLAQSTNFSVTLDKYGTKYSNGSSIITFYTNATSLNWTITVFNRTFNENNFKYNISPKENYNFTFYHSVLYTINFVDEAKETKFNFSNPELDSVDLTIICPNSTDRYFNINNNKQVNASCKWARMKFDVSYTNGTSTYYRSLPYDPYKTNWTVYLLDVSVKTGTTVVYQDFILNDITNLYENPRLEVTKYFGTTNAVIHSDYADAIDKVRVYFIPNDEYSLTIYSDTGTKVLGRYIPTTSGETILNLLDIDSTGLMEDSSVFDSSTFKITNINTSDDEKLLIEFDAEDDEGINNIEIQFFQPTSASGEDCFEDLTPILTKTYTDVGNSFDYYDELGSEFDNKTICIKTTISNSLYGSKVFKNVVTKGNTLGFNFEFDNKFGLVWIIILFVTVFALSFTVSSASFAPLIFLGIVWVLYFIGFINNNFSTNQNKVLVAVMGFATFITLALKLKSDSK